MLRFRDCCYWWQSVSPISHISRSMWLRGRYSFKSALSKHGQEQRSIAYSKTANILTNEGENWTPVRKGIQIFLSSIYFLINRVLFQDFHSMSQSLLRFLPGKTGHSKFSFQRSQNKICQQETEKMTLVKRHNNLKTWKIYKVSSLIFGSNLEEKQKKKLFY